jgi:hypothetical protein
MRHDRDPYRDHQYVPDTFWLVVAALLFAACGLIWLIGQVAAILLGPHHQHLPVRLVDMLGGSRGVEHLHEESPNGRAGPKSATLSPCGGMDRRSGSSGRWS